MECTNSLLPLGHYYQPCLQPDLTLGLTKLSDKSLLTVLLQDHVGELQVLHDQYWVDVPPVLGALVVNKQITRWKQRKLLPCTFLRPYWSLCSGWRVGLSSVAT
ncbi:hypothetical protein YC2023_017985 [Brassica napus]